MYISLSVVSLSLAFTLAACAPTDQPGQTAQAIKDGVADPNTDAVVVFAHMVGAGEMCSAQLIASDLVLTARHCVATNVPSMGGCQTPVPDIINASDGYVFIGDSLDDPALSSVRVAEILTPPEAASGIWVCGSDLVVLRLAKPIDVTPLDVGFDPVPVGATLSVVGFGASVPDDQNTVGTRRRLDGVTLTAYGENAPDLIVYGPQEFKVDRGPCGGDSGGPALDAMGRTVGVMSRGVKTLCTDMVYEAIAPHADWLRSVGADSATRTGKPVPWSVPPAPDAGSDPMTEHSGCSLAGHGQTPVTALIGILLLGLARLRRTPRRG